MASAASSAAPGNPELLFEGVLKNMKLTSTTCTDVEQGVEQGVGQGVGQSVGQGGGVGPEISIEDITVLIILFHGRTDLTQEVVKRGREKDLDTIDVDSLSNVNNLAYLALAPTGQVNMGTSANELNCWNVFLKNDMIIHIIDAITGKFNRLITAKPIYQPETKPESRLSIICKYCFTLLPDTVLSFLGTSLETFLPYLNRLFSNFTFTGNFMVCRTVEPAVSAVSASVQRTRGTVQRPRDTVHPYIKPPPKPSVSTSVSMNFEMFLLLLESLRISIKNFDTSRFPGVCKLIPDPWPEYCKCAYKSMGQRCRNLAILKGFGVGTHTPFINKVLAYDHGNATNYGDTLLGMGVRKLNFTMGRSGKVICNSEFFTPDDVTTGVGAQIIGTTSWFDMQGCIHFCTSGIHAKNSKTVFVLDMSCSSNGTGIFKTVTTTSKDFGAMGGGKRIKKKSGSMKKTRRIKNKSKSTRYIRNRRNRLKHNKRTKKGRKTKTYRKH